MFDFLAPLFLWIKALHVISVIAWMAGLLYLPRLFVYHCDAPPGSEMSERFKVMEYRLFRFIMGSAMHGAWTFGILMMLTPGVIDWQAGWWHVKLTMALVMTGLHVLFGRWTKDFRHDRKRRPQKHYRIANELPTVVMIVIVIMVIVRPF